MLHWQGGDSAIHTIRCIGIVFFAGIGCVHRESWRSRMIQLIKAIASILVWIGIRVIPWVQWMSVVSESLRVEMIRIVREIHHFAWGETRMLWREQCVVVIAGTANFHSTGSRRHCGIAGCRRCLLGEIMRAMVDLRNIGNLLDSKCFDRIRGSRRIS